MSTGDSAGLPTRHVVSPPSCRSWFDAFCSAPWDHVHYVGERDTDESAVLDLLSGVGPARIAIHAGHRSLARDHRLATELRRRGYPVIGPGAHAVELGLNKVAMKQWFAGAGIATPSGPTGRSGSWVVKRRFGTEGAGMSLVSGRAPVVDDQHYVEAYVEGEECSVVVFRGDGRTVVLPPVWKGRSNSALVPPYRRMRVCPGEPEQRVLEEEMIAISTAISAGVPCEGWLEVEFVVDPDGVPLVLEINPRVSGTMRLAAMAAQVRIFDIASDPAFSGRLAARAYGVEVPWEGPAFVRPADGVFATSRLTVSGATKADAFEALHRLLDRSRTPRVPEQLSS
ncbi:MAG: carbamoyl-phosphate synthase, large subunit, CarB [Nocardia sp.]|uniref:ATP-grasp domain-containing protein n=1 Tax=Nocardia sp. TaxID=1821 RepID=UPI0026384F97|nr:ATP-grasp domain-containing protein [Nocardia sp.]MCU1640736.1 carbamoyl-phosphate synthase, large subunit, CarB [Nocardia sp.]